MLAAGTILKGYLELYWAFGTMAERAPCTF